MDITFNFVLNDSISKGDKTVFTAIRYADNGLHRITWGEKDEFGKEKFQIYLPEHVKKHIQNKEWLIVD